MLAGTFNFYADLALYVMHSHAVTTASVRFAKPYKYILSLSCILRLFSGFSVIAANLHSIVHHCKRLESIQDPIACMRINYSNESDDTYWYTSDITARWHERTTLLNSPH